MVVGTGGREGGREREGNGCLGGREGGRGREMGACGASIFGVLVFGEILPMSVLTGPRPRGYTPRVSAIRLVDPPVRKVAATDFLPRGSCGLTLKA